MQPATPNILRGYGINPDKIPSHLKDDLVVMHNTKGSISLDSVGFLIELDEPDKILEVLKVFPPYPLLRAILIYLQMDWSFQTQARLMLVFLSLSAFLAFMKTQFL